MASRPHIYFRADGHKNMGLGHVVRSLALADLLKESYSCHFVIRDPMPALAQQIAMVCHEIHPLPADSDYEAEAHYLVQELLRPGDRVVLDGYVFETRYQEILKGRGCRVLCIDDIHACHFVADAVINPAGGVEEAQYDREAYTRLYLGMEYALLRRPFLDAMQLPFRLAEREGVFICMGGADITNQTARLIRAGFQVPDLDRMEIVLGAANPYREEVEALLEQAPAGMETHLHGNLSAAEMVSVMRRCRLGICPASGLSLEVMAVGMGLLTGKTADNQEDILRGIELKKTGVNLGWFDQNGEADLADRMQECLEPGRIEEMVHAQKAVFATSPAIRLRAVIDQL